MVAGDTLDAYANRVEKGLIFGEALSKNRVAMLRCKAYCNRAVALMQSDATICISKADNLIARKWVASLTTLILETW